MRRSERERKAREIGILFFHVSMASDDVIAPSPPPSSSFIYQLMEEFEFQIRVSVWNIIADWNLIATSTPTTPPLPPGFSEVSVQFQCSFGAVSELDR